MPATLEVIRERLDELQRRLDAAAADGQDVSAIKKELNELFEQYNAAMKLVSDGKQLLQG